MTRAIDCSMGVSGVKGEGRRSRRKVEAALSFLNRSIILLNCSIIYCRTKRSRVKEFITEWFIMPSDQWDVRAVSTRATR